MYMLYYVEFFHNDYPIPMNKPTLLYNPRPQISTYPQSHNFKQLPALIKCPHPASLTFLNSRNKRKSWFYCHFIHTFLSFNYRRIVFFPFQLLVFLSLCVYRVPLHVGALSVFWFLFYGCAYLIIDPSIRHPPSKKCPPFSWDFK